MKHISHWWRNLLDDLAFLFKKAVNRDDWKNLEAKDQGLSETNSDMPMFNSGNSDFWRSTYQDFESPNGSFNHHNRDHHAN